MRNGKWVVLIVEDDLYIGDMWQMALDGQGFELLLAPTIDEATAKFAENLADLDAIVMDACVPGDSPTTPPLVLRFREAFRGPMIAASSVAEYRTVLMRAGCDYQCEKKQVPSMIRRVLTA